MIGGYFKWHWLYPTQIAVKIDDPASPINARVRRRQPADRRANPPRGVLDRRRGLHLQRGVVRRASRAHILTSIDYAKMPAEVKAQEPAPQRTDHDYALS